MRFENSIVRGLRSHFDKEISDAEEDKPLPWSEAGERGC
jgi:hypothetical protein